jgi:hypothetical protein
MPVYAIKNLTRYNHPPPLKPQHCPHTPNPIVYGKDNQAPTPGNTSPLLDATGKQRIQQIVGSFLYYARAVDPTILMALSAIATQQVPLLQKHLLVSTNSSTTCGHTPVQKLDTELPTLSATYTLMPPISVPPRHKVVQEANTSLVVFHETTNQSLSTAQSISPAPFSN